MVDISRVNGVYKPTNITGGTTLWESLLWPVSKHVRLSHAEQGESLGTVVSPT